MIDLARDIHITSKDIEEQTRIWRKRIRPMGLEEYLKFLRRVNRLFTRGNVKKKVWKPFNRPFEL